jgi:hypothetical protein
VKVVTKLKTLLSSHGLQFLMLETTIGYAVWFVDYLFIIKQTISSYISYAYNVWRLLYLHWTFQWHPFNYFTNLKHPHYSLNTKIRPMFYLTLRILVFVFISNPLEIFHP